MVTSVKPLVVIVGTTASGKSTLAMELARKHDGEIVSADSRAVYIGMDIGTSKPSKQDQAEVSHHLIDVVEPSERFTAAQFKKLAIAAIEDIRNRGKLPILCGGTGLYVNSVIFNYKFKQRPKKSLRKALEAFTSDELAEKVQKNGGVGIDLKNRRHMMRFLESGPTSNEDDKLIDNTVIVGIRRKKNQIRERSKQRTEMWFRMGLKHEIDELVAKYGWDSEAMTGSIYRLFKEFEDGDISMSELKRKNVLRDLQYAKRQRTWFRRNPYIKWFDDGKGALEFIEKSIVD